MTGAAGWKMIQCSYPGCTEKFGRAARLVEHKRAVHGMGMDITREQIDKAIKCVNWQDFRIMLKGLSTGRKLVRLGMYMRADLYCGVNPTCCTEETRRVQVLNYLNALSRGGQIEPLDNTEKSKLWETPYNVEARIKR